MSCESGKTFSVMRPDDVSDISITVCHADEAQKLWPRLLEGLADPAQYYGPDVEPDRVRADCFYRLTVDGECVGLGWVRRFTRLGHVMSYGKGFIPEARGRRLSAQVSAQLVKRIITDYPESALIALIWGTNPHRARFAGVRVVGEIREALPTGESLHIVQIHRGER